jgi:hypothetical protein
MRSPDAKNRSAHCGPINPNWIYAQSSDIAGYRINPVRLGHAQLRQYCFYASFETRNQVRTPQTELNGVVLRILVVLGGIWRQNKAKVSVFNGSVR